MRPGERAARAAAYERARPEIIAHVPPAARRVLDLGCATGTTGAALKARQAVEVVGVELEPDYAREAAKRLDRVIDGRRRGAAPDGPRPLRRACSRPTSSSTSRPLGRPEALRRRCSSPAPPRSSSSPTSPTGAPTRTCSRRLAAPARGHLRRHPPALVHAAGRPRAAAPGRTATPHGRPPRLDHQARLARGRLAPPLLQVPGVRTLITFQHVIAAIYPPPACP